MSPSRPAVRPHQTLAVLALLSLALPSTAEERWTYTVGPGDTLIGIARDLLRRPADWRALQRLNGVAEPRRMRPGRQLQIPLDWLSPDASVATVAAQVGPVAVERPGAPERSVQVGSTLRSADTVRTGADASATIELADGSRVVVAPESRLTLQQLIVLRGAGLSSTVLDLHEGSAESQVRPEAPRPRFEIRTPTMTLGVRGTEFRAHADLQDQRARAEVTQGRVAAASGTATTAVGVGYGIVATARGLDAPRELIAAPDLSGVATRIERLPLQFSWRGGAPAVAWRAQVLGLGEPPRLLRDGRFGEPRARFTELPDGDYLLRVRGIDAAGLEGLNRDLRFTLKARPEPPAIQSPPADGRVYGATATWRWTLSTAAQTYRLQVAASPDFASPVIDRSGLAGPAFESPLPPGRWHWRLASVRADGDFGPWSDVQVFEQREVPPPPATQGSSLAPEQLMLRWSARRSDDRYRFQLARDVHFTDLVADRPVDRAEAELPLPPAGRYWLRVRTVDADGEVGPWGTPSEVTVPSPPLPPWWWIGPALWLLIAL